MGPSADKFAVYGSHSWRPGDVDLNRLVWSEIAKASELLVDVPDDSAADPPYYISRIEELLRRSDLFVSVLPHRTEADRPTGGSDVLQCSVYALFEIRLVERFNLPRLVLYEQSTGFRPPPRVRPSECYVPFVRGRGEVLPEQSNWRKVIQPKIQQWLEWINDHRRPASYEQSTNALVLMPPGLADDGTCEALESALREAGYDAGRLDPRRHGNTQAFRMLHEAGLIVADVGGADAPTAELYAAAHSLCIPAIRVLDENARLPWILQGHPGGYQHDIVRWTEGAQLAEPIVPRARAMFRLSRALDDESARRYFESKRYAPHTVFLSHTLKPPHRALVDQVFERLRQRYVNCFEYHQTNPAGEAWKTALADILGKTTHFVVVLTDGYELSPVCTYELEEILKRGREVTMLPFMANGRSVPHPKLGEMHHRLLSGPDPGADADAIVGRVIDALLAGRPTLPAP